MTAAGTVGGDAGDAPPRWADEAEDLRTRLTALESSGPRRDNPWWLLLATGVASAMLPVATLVHSVYQADIEAKRRDNEIELAAQSQRISQEKEWLEIAVDASRAEAQRDQVLRFLAKGDGRVGEWAREESTHLKQVIEQLKKDLESAKAALGEAKAQAPGVAQAALADKVDMLKVRLGQAPPDAASTPRRSPLATCTRLSKEAVTPDIAAQLKAILSAHYSKPLGTKVPFEVGGQSYSAVTSEVRAGALSSGRLTAHPVGHRGGASVRLQANRAQEHRLARAQAHVLLAC